MTYNIEGMLQNSQIKKKKLGDKYTNTLDEYQICFHKHKIIAL